MPNAAFDSQLTNNLSPGFFVAIRNLPANDPATHGVLFAQDSIFDMTFTF